MPQWLADFCSWLELTHFSQILQNVEWIIPAIQTVHILCIGAVISAALALTLRQFGLLAADQPLARASSAFLRVIWLALPVLLVTGSLLVVAEPNRSLGSPAFQLKMALLVCVVSLLIGYQRRFARVTASGPQTVVGSRRGEATAIAALFLWVCIIFAGRWIAYAAGK
jgi:hypothetical protein